MARQDWPENLPSLVLSRIPPLTFDMRQTVLALALNLGIIGISAFLLILNQQAVPDLLDILLFLLLLSYIVWFTADLPEGIPLMRYGTAVALAALILDRRWAILLAIGASGIGVLVSLIFRRRMEQRPHPRQIVTRTLWVNAGIATALVCAALIFPGAIPTSHMVLTNLVEYGKAAGLLIVYFALLLGMLSGWLRFQHIRLRPFFRSQLGGAVHQWAYPWSVYPSGCSWIRCMARPETSTDRQLLCHRCDQQLVQPGLQLADRASGTTPRHQPHRASHQRTTGSGRPFCHDL